MSNLSIAMILAVGASVCWALANLAVQRSARLVGTVRGLLWAQVIGGAVAAGLALALDQRPAVVSGAVLAWLVVAGVSSLSAYLCMFYTLEHGRLSISVPIMAGWSVISTALSVVWLREPARPAQLVGAALVITGVTLVSRYAQQAARAGEPAVTNPLAGPTRRPRWVLAAMGAALGFGVLIPSIGRLTPAAGNLGAVAAVFSFDMLLGLPLALIFRINLRPPRGAAWVPVALAGLLEAGGFVCIALAVGRAALVVVSPLASLASTIAVLYAWIVQRDRPPPVALAGAVLACAGVVVLAL
jgi:drug/metabolite transporter (DMT)-like permease